MKKKIIRKNGIINIALKTQIVGTSSLELPRRGDSNEYPQSMFWIKKYIPQ